MNMTAINDRNQFYRVGHTSTDYT